VDAKCWGRCSLVGDAFIERAQRDLYCVLKTDSTLSGPARQGVEDLAIEMKLFDHHEAPAFGLARRAHAAPIGRNVAQLREKSLPACDQVGWDRPT
jgi:hypothetical protein